MKPTNGKLKKRAAIIIAVLALAVTAIGGTYAWQDYRQHKSNELSGTMPKYDVTLVEEFDEVPDWKVEDGQITKRISVTNLGIAKKNFGDVYVRIQLKEYMEIGSLTYELSPKRYMIDIEGEFIILTEQEAINATAQGGLYEGHTYAQLTDAVSGRTGWFIETRDGDPNGQMGKHLITKITIGTPEAVIKNGPQQQAADKNHHGRIEIIDGKSVIVTESDECHYAVHSWKPGSELETRAFIEWQLNTGAILPLSQWLAGGSKPVAKWIYDDLSDSGWVYWGQVLKTDGDTTADFMESVSLIHQPDGDFYYVIHVELDAVSLDELDSWGDVGDEFLKNAPSAKFNSEPPKTVKEGETVNSPGVTVGPEGADQQVTWSSSNRDIATVDANGVVTGVKPGTVTITATAGNGAKVWYTLTVTPGDPTEIPATDVTIQGGDREMEIGDSYTPQIVVTPPDHTDTPQWSSSDPDVAMVDENGKITAVGEGEAVITVTVGDRQDSITVTVKPAADPDLPLQDNTDPFKPDVGTDAESNFCLWLKGDIDDFSKVKVVQAGSVKLKDILLPGTDLDGFSVTAVNSDMDGHFTVGTDKGSDKAILFTYYPPIQTWLDADPNLPQVTTTVILAKEGFKPATITLLLLYEGSIVG